MKAEQIKGIIYRVYFESMYSDPLQKNGVTYCTVIANNVTEAIAKVKSIFPGGMINSIHSEREFRDGPAIPDTILL